MTDRRFQADFERVVESIATYDTPFSEEITRPCRLSRNICPTSPVKLLPVEGKYIDEYLELTRRESPPGTLVATTRLHKPATENWSAAHKVIIPYKSRISWSLAVWDKALGKVTLQNSLEDPLVDDDHPLTEFLADLGVHAPFEKVPSLELNHFLPDQNGLFIMIAARLATRNMRVPCNDRRFFSYFRGLVWEELTTHHLNRRFWEIFQLLVPPEFPSTVRMSEVCPTTLDTSIEASVSGRCTTDETGRLPDGVDSIGTRYGSASDCLERSSPVEDVLDVALGIGNLAVCSVPVSVGPQSEAGLPMAHDDHPLTSKATVGDTTYTSLNEPIVQEGRVIDSSQVSHAGGAGSDGLVLSDRYPQADTDLADSRPAEDFSRTCIAAETTNGRSSIQETTAALDANAADRLTLSPKRVGSRLPNEFSAAALRVDSRKTTTATRSSTRIKRSTIEAPATCPPKRLRRSGKRAEDAAVIFPNLVAHGVSKFGDRPAMARTLHEAVYSRRLLGTKPRYEDLTVLLQLSGVGKVALGNSRWELDHTAFDLLRSRYARERLARQCSKASGRSRRFRLKLGGPLRDDEWKKLWLELKKTLVWAELCDIFVPDLGNDAFVAICTATNDDRKLMLPYRVTSNHHITGNYPLDKRSNIDKENFLCQARENKELILEDLKCLIEPLKFVLGIYNSLKTVPIESASVAFPPKALYHDGIQRLFLSQ